MTPQAQRIAIAEALNLELMGDGNLSMGSNGPYLMVRKVGQIGLLYWRVRADWLSDLNAMHEAEKTLEDKKDYTGRCAATNRYCHELDKLCKPFNDQPPYICSYPWHASAAQRAEAFLRTLGKWE